MWVTARRLSSLTGCSSRFCRYPLKRLASLRHRVQHSPASTTLFQLKQSALLMMEDRSDSLFYFGTAERLLGDRQFSAGALTLHISDGAVRRLCWHGVEVVRCIACPVRDANWATCVSVLAEESVTEKPDGFEVRQARLVADGAVRVELVFKASAKGVFQAVSEISVCREFITNRAGFTLLHPLRHVAGTPLSVAHPDGLITVSEFPLL